jgi:gamma-glutamyltranspeptidase / glutathione hydrolase
MRPLLAGCVAVTVAACGSEPSAAYKSGSLSPDRWDPEASARAWQTFGAWTRDTSIETSGGGVVVDASVAPAALAGAAALDAGGSAIDAALTAALTGSVVGLGGPVTLGGIAALVYYDASSGKTYSVDGGWLVPPSEPDPGSIPVDVPSGRAILVPGFMALVESAQGRFGRLPFPALFEPAITIAEEGFELPEHLARMVESNVRVLGRRPTTRSIFTNAEGGWVEAGDVLRQPELAATLRQVAASGADHMYEGAWAEALVTAVREAGGSMTMADLASYEPAWSESAHAAYGAFEIHVPGGNSPGGTNLLEAMQLLDRARVRASGPVSESAESFYWVSRVGYLLWVSDFRMADFEGVILESCGSPLRVGRGWRA